MDLSFLEISLLVPPGAWGVAVSGGADSVALLLLLKKLPHLALHVIHLDHETRGEASQLDAEFVRDLAVKLGLPATISLRSEVEKGVPRLPANPSSRYRAARLALFRQVVAAHHLMGVIVAQHQDDQIETIFLRLLRGSGPMGLAGMEAISELGGLQILRPLLDFRSSALRNYLTYIGQPWREDASNASDAYLRNRVRRFSRGDHTLLPRR